MGLLVAAVLALVSTAIVGRAGASGTTALSRFLGGLSIVNTLAEVWVRASKVVRSWQSNAPVVLETPKRATAMVAVEVGPDDEYVFRPTAYKQYQHPDRPHITVTEM
jgi:hypothetical protein